METVNKFIHSLKEAKSVCYVIKARIQGMNGDDWKYYNSKLDNWVSHITLKMSGIEAATLFAERPSDERLGKIFKLRRAPNIVEDFGDDANITEAQILVYNKRNGKLEDKEQLSSDDIIQLTGGHHYEESKLRESISSPNCWEDWYLKLIRLADDDTMEMTKAIEKIDEIHEKVGEFKNMDAFDKEELNEALDTLAGAENYELYTAFEDMCDYFGFNELQESKKDTRKRVKESYDSDCRTSVKAMFYNHDPAEIEAMVEEINDIHNTTFFTRELGKKVYIESGTLFTSIAKLEDVLEEFVQRGATEVNFIKA